MHFIYYLLPKLTRCIQLHNCRIHSHDVHASNWHLVKSNPIYVHLSHKLHNVSVFAGYDENTAWTHTKLSSFIIHQSLGFVIPVIFVETLFRCCFNRKFGWQNGFYRCVRCFEFNRYLFVFGTSVFVMDLLCLNLCFMEICNTRCISRFGRVKWLYLCSCRWKSNVTKAVTSQYNPTGYQTYNKCNWTKSLLTLPQSIVLSITYLIMDTT